MSDQPKHTHEQLKQNILYVCANIYLAKETLTLAGLSIGGESIHQLLEAGRNSGMMFSEDQVRYATTGYWTPGSPQGEPGALREEAGREPALATPKDGTAPLDQFSAEGATPQGPSDGNDQPLPEDLQERG